jgi:anti-sigma regulatory factor (Ser/Thr protein kinase)
MNQALPHVGSPTRAFTQLLSSTRRGARLARLLAAAQLRSWGVPPGLTERAELVVAELAANAVLHGRVSGCCFRLTLAFDPPAGRLRVDVTDARGGRDPRPASSAPDAEELRPGGRGLTLVAALADHWECVAYPASGKTVRAELTVSTRE